MLSPAEALLIQAAKDEEERKQAISSAGMLGVSGGGILGALGGQVPHSVLKNTSGRIKGNNFRFKPGARLAGGLTGAILGGALGSGTAALMKRESPAAVLLGKIQAQGGKMTPQDELALAAHLGEVYTNPSELGM